MKSQAMILPSKMLCSLVAGCLALAVVVISPHHSLAAPKTAVATNDFLNSIGVVSTFPDRGQPLARTIEMVRYCGFRWVRAGIEGLSDKGPTTVQTFLDLHRETGARLNWGLVSGGTDVKKLVETGRVLAEAGALLAFEGNNEPNNWGVTYQGESGGGTASWMAVAKLQRDLYQAVKSDPVLAKYPVWSISEPGAQRDNVGLQFLTIPPDAQTRMPDGTKYADYANLHNYIYHSHSPYPADNKTWHAADPTAASRVDGLFGNFGVTWGRGFQGYTQEQLNTLPRVTTETGVAIGGSVTEQMHGLNLMSMYLAQFKRGYAYTSVYLLRDRTDEDGNQSFGFFKPDYSPRKAAIYLHNLTTILADKGTLAKPGQLDFTIADQPETVHELLLQHSDGTFQLIVWDERLSGQDHVTVQFGDTRASVTTYDPTIGVEPVQTLSNVRSLEITLSDHPIVIALSPSMQ
ncbi:MAG: glycosyl hydrolase [Mesorhizobium sp.]|uniref:glycosyl hydrolase n=1 Tax=Mesorhizobium sp. TaxID=1871066 RepID=UPI000FE5F559|nr:glycosyl hydrolase [Mesorhizobium sp.]RWC95678.1 MAG: glycosyl hydrolase [Mesorhizobium sp.]TIW72265.1 MAG: glycosyl hydrolase [Mesorhizobium sp.]